MKRDEPVAGGMIGTARIIGVKQARLPDVPKGKPLAQVFAEEETAPKTQRGPRKRSAGELRYEEFLTAMQLVGKVQFIESEAWKIVLADRTTYRPDFFVVLADGTPCMVEIKGFWTWDDSRVKFKVAREMFPCYRWLCLEYKAGKWRILFKTGLEPLDLVP